MSPPRSLPVQVALLIIVVMTMAAFAATRFYHGVLHFGVLSSSFTSWDDYETVARNPLLNPPAARSLVAFWTRPHGHLYIPVTYTAWFAAARVAYEPATASSPP